ncbi:MAG: HEPN domain-containing protein [Candidatus Hadarchaeaceae archaeon]
MVEMQIEKHLYSNYLKKAREYLDGMKDELTNQRWNLAVLAGVHCAISACDALTIFFLGKKHKGIKHADAAKLLASIEGINSRELSEKSNQFISILDFKTPVEYDKTMFKEWDARELAKRIERFYGWVREKLPE